MVTLADFGYRDLGYLVFFLPNTVKLFGFQIFWFWRYLMKVIPEMRRAYWIWYLLFFLY